MPFLLAIVLTLTSPAARWESERFPPPEETEPSTPRTEA